MVYEDYDDPYRRAVGSATAGDEERRPPRGPMTPTPPWSEEYPTGAQNTTPSTFDPTKDRNNPPAPFPGYEWYWTDSDGWRARPTGGGGGGSTGGGGGGGGWSGKFGAMPDYQMLDFPEYLHAPDFVPRDSVFEFDPYTPIDREHAENVPGFKASRDRLRKQVEAGAASRGVLRSGMTIGDIYTNLDALSEQNLRAEDDRKYRSWEGNLTASRNKWLDEYNIDKDIHSFKVQDVDRQNRYRFDVADRSFADALSRWRAQLESLTSIATSNPD